MAETQQQQSSDPISTTVVRPKIDWDALGNQCRARPKPEIFVKQEEVEDGYDDFRRVSGKVARSRYDIPPGHSLIVAYSQYPSKPAEAVGVVTFISGDKCLNNPRKSYNYMDDYYHKISFIFVDRDYQRMGVGSQLLQGALDSMMNDNQGRPVRLEGAKSAVKFFRKMGFVTDGKPEVSASRKGSRLFWEIYRMQHPAAVKN